jgi:two-component system, oxyanion-binding sensor
MSEVVSLPAGRGNSPKLRIGLLRLTDGAPVIIAQELGFFADEDVDVAIVVEPSWANIADKLAYGFFDAAVILPPLAFAIELGRRSAAQPIVIPYTISAGGNTVTLGNALANEISDRAASQGLSTVEALALCLRERPVTLGVVHAYSTHNLLLRYWLATAGIDAGHDVKLAVIPPAQAVEALSCGHIAGFCAGAPWGEVARRAKAGVTIATSRDIWRNAPEKALAVRARYVQDHPDVLAGAIRALLRAAKFCDDPQNASYTAAVLARSKYLAVDSHAILAGLPGTIPERGCVFFRGAATFPWRSQGLWFLCEMRRWGLIEDNLDLVQLIERVYRPDLYRAALAGSNEPIPAMDWKSEGAHDEPWEIAGIPYPIPAPADRFCDGRVFDPDAAIMAPRGALGALHNF